MTVHYNRSSEKSNRKNLRQKSTYAESLLWERLRGRKFLGMKFKRQYSVDQFVLDFYCPEKRFAIELDGKVHEDNYVKNHDENRDEFIKDFNIKILRIKNELVIKDTDAALNLIRQEMIGENKD